MSSTQDDHNTRRVGTTLREKWVLERLLGVGGMASVYAARHKIGRLDAIKILHPKVAANEQLRARFEQEAHAVNAFKHPGVVEIRDVDTAEDGAPFLVMELLEGETLAQRIDREGRMETRAILTIAAEVLDVLAAAHAQGIVHRDIKPDNIFLAGAAVKVLDFGIARVRSADKRALTTKAGVTLGTMAYMAPEQARGEEIDGRADVYAVGATTFRALAGRFVHEADTQAALVLRVIAYDAPRLATAIPDVPPAIAAVVDRALAFEPAHRYPDAATMLADVRAALAGAEPPYAAAAPPIPDRSASSSLFDLTAGDGKGKPTVLARRRVEAEAGATQVGGGGVPIDPSIARPTPPTVHGPADVPPSALPTSATIGAPGAASSARPSGAATRVSPVHPLAGTAAAGPASERVVIVPSQHGVPPTADMRRDDVGQIATVHGLAPPPGIVRVQQAPAPAPTAEALLTPYAELSAFIKKRPPIALVAVIGGIALLALVFVVGTIVYLTRGDADTTHEAAGTPADTATPTTTATATGTQTGGATALPPPKTPLPPARPHRR